MLKFSKVLRGVKQESIRLVWWDRLSQMKRLVWPDHMFWVYLLLQLNNLEQRKLLLWTYSLTARVLISLGYGKPKNEKWQKMAQLLNDRYRQL